MKVIYYYHYLFYKNFIRDSDPKSLATFVVAFSESALINCILSTILAYYFCFKLSKYYMISIFFITLFLNYIYFLNSKKIEEIVKTKPKLYGSHILSLLLSWLFFFISSASLFWMGLYLNDIIANCH